MLASTVQFSSYGRIQPEPTACRSHARRRAPMVRCRLALSVTEPPLPPPPAPEGTSISSSRGSQPPKKRSAPKSESVPSGPNSAPGPSHLDRPRSHRQAGCTRSVPRRDGLLVSVPPLSSTPRANVSSVGLDPTAKAAGQVLLRKEVIQPHLPVRLPCYDFVPIADPTFDSSLSCELGHWLRVLPTFVT